MQENKFLTHILTDIKVKLEAEFKENFTRKAFLMKNGKILLTFFNMLSPYKINENNMMVSN